MSIELGSTHKAAHVARLALFLVFSSSRRDECQESSYISF